MTPEQWEAVRASDIWQNVVAPILLQRQHEIDKALRKAADERTTHLLQGGAAELEYLIGDPERDAIRKARLAEAAKHQEKTPDERSGNAPRGNDRARRLAERQSRNTG